MKYIKLFCACVDLNDVTVLSDILNLRLWSTDSSNDTFKYEKEKNTLKANKQEITLKKHTRHFDNCFVEDFIFSYTLKSTLIEFVLISEIMWQGRDNENQLMANDLLWSSRK